MSTAASVRWTTSQTAIAAACLGLAAGFAVWMLTVTPADLDEPGSALARYALRLVPALVAAGILCAVCNNAARTELLGRLAYTSGFAYLAVLDVAGFAWAPWLALALVGVGAASTRRHVAVERSLLILALVGTLSGLYVAVNFDRYARGFGPFEGVLRALWQLVTG